MPQGRGALVGRRIDGWLVGGAAVGLWAALQVGRVVGGPTVPGPGRPLTDLFVAASAAHFGVSYHLAYADGDGRRQHRPALLAVPVAATALVVLAWAARSGPVSHGLFRILVGLVFALTIWHYVKQAYGVARVEASLAGIPIGRSDGLVLRYSLYPLWALSLVRLGTSGSGGTEFGYRVGVEVLPHWLTPVAAALCLVGLAAFGSTVVALGIRNRRIIPAAIWTPHVAGFVWVAFAPSYAATAVVLSTAHALQYLACSYRAERSWAAARDQAQPNLWLLCVAATSAVGGLLATTWLAPTVSALSGGAWSAAQISIGLFVVLNLHHYAIDASIWRSSGGHVRRIAGRSAAAPVPGRPVPAFAGAAQIVT